MFGPAFHRKMNQLALVAMLLLLALPTAGRVINAVAPASNGVWAQLCTMTGLKLVKVDMGTSNPLPAVPGGDPSPMHPDGGAMPGMDCEYCPVLGGMVVLLLVLLFAAPDTARGSLLACLASAPQQFLYPGGPGLRGPPIAL